MTLLQFAIGALNDIVDAPADVGRIPPKPIPAGLVGPALARGVVAVAAAIGLLVAALSGGATLLVAVVVLVVGVVYDLFAKGTPWSWLPFAVGIPLLPVYGWLGVTGEVPDFFVVLVPMAVLAGAGLAVANARVDLESDRAAGTRSVATELGDERSWWVGTLLFGAATVVGLVASTGGWAPGRIALVFVGTALVAAGAALGRGRGTGRRRAWEAQAIGAAIAATGWVAGLLPRP